MSELTKQECIAWLVQEIADGETYLRKVTDSEDELRAQEMRRATLQYLRSCVC